MKHLTPLMLLAVSLLAPGARGAGPVSEPELVRQSLVRIIATYQYPDFGEPWKPGTVSQGVGSGFVIAGKLIMTNAHVVSNAGFLMVDREGGEGMRYEATVKFVAHDCDLALLEVKDAAFLKNAAELSFGGTPEVNSSVAAYGYPIGGERMSVTRGIVSRVEFRPYAHSGMDSHLAIQVDAAINPGNSGGPVLQDGKVVGVAFQAIPGAVAQNTGYMIPVPVIQRFLKDIGDGKYDGYPELAIRYQNLMNPAYRRFLGLADDRLGVLVTDVTKESSAGGVIQVNDVLLKIDGHPIFANGRIALEGEQIQLEEIAERKQHGDKVTFDLLRAGKPQSVTMTLRGSWPFTVFAKTYERTPRYVIFAGLDFQPLNRNYFRAHKVEDLDTLYNFQFYVDDEIYLERPEMVVLGSVLPDPINSDLEPYANKLVDEVNGTRIRGLADLAAAFAAKAERYVIRLHRVGRPLVLEAAGVEAARARIRERYGVAREANLETPSETAPLAADPPK